MDLVAPEKVIKSWWWLNNGWRRLSNGWWRLNS
jgi:hypothetical protein